MNKTVVTILIALALVNLTTAGTISYHNNEWIEVNRDGLGELITVDIQPTQTANQWDVTLTLDKELKKDLKKEGNNPNKFEKAFEKHKHKVKPQNQKKALKAFKKADKYPVTLLYEEWVDDFAPVWKEDKNVTITKKKLDLINKEKDTTKITLLKGMKGSQRLKLGNESVVYEAATKVIRVLGFSPAAPANLTALYVADQQDAAYDCVTRYNVYTFEVTGCKIYIGDGTTPTWWKETDKIFIYKTWSGWGNNDRVIKFIGPINTVWGEIEDEDLKTSTRGVYFFAYGLSSSVRIFWLDQEADPGDYANFTLVGAQLTGGYYAGGTGMTPIVYFGPGVSESQGTTKLWNTNSIGSMYYAYFDMYNIDYNTHPLSSSRKYALKASNGSFNQVTMDGFYYPIHFYKERGMSLKNMRVTNFYQLWIQQITSTQYLTNFEMDSWTSWRYTTPWTGLIYVQYELDLKVVNRTRDVGNESQGINGAVVSVYNRSSWVGNYTTNSTGEIPTQTLIARHYYQGAANAHIDHTPYSIVISADGYQTINITYNPFERQHNGRLGKESWTVELLLEEVCEGEECEEVATTSLITTAITQRKQTSAIIILLLIFPLLIVICSVWLYVKTKEESEEPLREE